VKNTACMKDCATEIRVASALPEHARDAHGNLLEQNRPVGAVRGTETKRAGAAPSLADSLATGNMLDLAKRRACTACHAVDQRVLGPSFREISARYQGDAAAAGRLAEKTRRGGGGAWGEVPMPANPGLSEAESRKLVQWILAGAN
jgi:cytochrome c